MLAAQSPISSSSNQIRSLKTYRKPLQLKNSPATPLINTTTSLIKSKQWIEISTVPDNSSNKENIPPTDSFRMEQFDASLAEELSAIREKLERLRIDKEKTDKILKERDLLIDLQMNEVIQRGEEQKQLEIEVDRLFRLKELRLSCMRISPIRSLREKVIKPKKMEEEQLHSQEVNSIEVEE